MVASVRPWPWPCHHSHPLPLTSHLSSSLSAAFLPLVKRGDASMLAIKPPRPPKGPAKYPRRANYGRYRRPHTLWVLLLISPARAVGCNPSNHDVRRLGSVLDRHTAGAVVSTTISSVILGTSPLRLLASESAMVAAGRTETSSVARLPHERRRPSARAQQLRSPRGRRYRMYRIVWSLVSAARSCPLRGPPQHQRAICFGHGGRAWAASRPLIIGRTPQESAAERIRNARSKLKTPRVAWSHRPRCSDHSKARADRPCIVD
jgi:hypothetical protein